VPEITQYN